MKHTKLPWTDPRIYKNPKGEIYRVVVYGGDPLLSVHSQRTDWKNQLGATANAEFIVRACNSHYDLIEVCQTLVDSWNNAERHFRASHGDVVDSAVGMAREMIAKVENTI